MGYLSRIAVREADLFIIDQQLETSWHAPSTEVKLERHATGIDADVSLNDLDLDLADEISRTVGYNMAS